MTAAAYYNHGRWVAECPDPTCSDARLVYEINPQTGVPTGSRLDSDRCAAGHAFLIGMPPAEEEARIVAALERRPLPSTRNWFPAEHPTALAGGLPHGQTVADLEAETDAHLAAPDTPADRPPLEDLLAAYGLTLGADGTTLRRL